MVMGPSANAAKSASVASAKKMPATATSQSFGQTIVMLVAADDDPGAEQHEAEEGDGKNGGDRAYGARGEAREEIVNAPGQRGRQAEDH